MYASGECNTVDTEAAPYLSYKISAPKGDYTIWALTKITRQGADYIAVSVDGKEISADKLYNKGKLWRYEAEQIWRWVPIAETELSDGVHEINLYSRTIGIRFDRIYITSGDELPSAACDW